MSDDQYALIYAGQALPQIGQVVSILAAELKVKELRVTHNHLAKMMKLMNDCITALEVEEILKHVR